MNIPLAETKDDQRIDITVSYANTEVDKHLVPFADSVPIEGNPDLVERAKYLALLYAQQRWFRSFSQLKRSQDMEIEIDNTKKSLTDTLLALRTTRTKRVAVAQERPFRLLLPSFKETFPLGEDF